MDTITASPTLLTPLQAAHQLGTTPGALAQLRYTGRGPRFVKLSARSVRYRQGDLDAFVEAAVCSRSDDRPGAA